MSGNRHNVDNKRKKTNHHGFVPKGYPGWGDILSIVGVFFVATILIKLIVDSLVDIQGGFPMFLSYTLSFVVVVAYALGLKYFRTGNISGVMRVSARGFNPGMILWGIILMLVASVLIEPVIELFPEKYMGIIHKATTNGGWSMVTALIAAPVFEEMLFRGIIQEGLTRKYGAAQGILVASLIFGIVHVIPQQVVAASVLGIILGYIYYRTGSLISVVIIHAVNNSLALFSMILTDAASISTRDVIGSDKIYYMVYGACAVIAVISFVRIGTNIRKSDKRALQKRMEEEAEKAKKDVNEA